MNAKKKTGFKIWKDDGGYRLQGWYDLGTGKVWDGIPSLFSTRKAAEAAGRARCNK